MENNNKELTISAPKTIMEMVKTFEDACQILGEYHSLVAHYKEIADRLEGYDGKELLDLYAFLKLRIIAAALNEGWTPKFDREEIRWYPHFYILTKEGYDRLDEDEKKECRVVGRAVSDAGVGVGFFFSAASFAWSASGKDYGYRLSFRTDELAEYCGKQFIDLWIEYLIG